MKIRIGRFQWNSRIEHRRLALLMLVALVALTAGITVIVGIVRLPAPAPKAPPANPEALNLAGAKASPRSRIFRERAQLLDNTPLYLPTPHNFSQTYVESATHRDPDDSFKAVDPRFAYDDKTFSIAFPERAEIPGQPVEALAFGKTQTPYAPFGRVEHPLTPLPPRLGFVEVVQAKTGRTVFALPIEKPQKQTVALSDTPTPATSEPPEALLTGDWSPLEFFVSVDVVGLVGSPMLVKGGAANPAIVRFFENYLVKNLRIGNRPELSAGFYVLRVGP